MTLFIHGFGGSSTDTAPLASGVKGTRVLPALPGHGEYPDPADPAAGFQWTYNELARYVLEIADQVGASRALGISLGAATLLRIAWELPDRFDRLVFYLPAQIDALRPTASLDHLQAIERAARAGDTEAVQALVAEEVPAERRGDAARWIADRTELMMRPQVIDASAAITRDRPMPDAELLEKVTVPALVIGQQDDPMHPIEIARDLAERLPHSQLELFGPGALWNYRARLRSVISGFLNQA